MEVVISDVIKMIKEGKTRQEIADFYQLPLYVMQRNVFVHPAIKNLRASKYAVNVIDDVKYEEVNDDPQIVSEEENPFKNEIHTQIEE